MEIRKVHVSLLNPAAYNPRKDLQPGDTQYESLQRAIDEFGYVEPIIWNERTGNVVGGHQRLKILLVQGAQEVDVSVVDLDDTREKALNIALNKISGSWDDKKLSTAFDYLLSTNIDITLTGFDLSEIDLLTVPDDMFVSIDDMNLSAVYKEPEKKKIRCPKCSHVDTADRFVKV